MYKLIIIATLLALTVGSAFARGTDDSLTDMLFPADNAVIEIMRSGFSGAANDKLDVQAQTDPGELNPGKALLLSAILPGAGEYYAGSKWRAALFFGIEVAAWSAVIYYYNAGQDKDKEFKEYADEHFDADIYRDVEWARAIGSADSEVYDGTREQWEALDWGDRIQFLPDQGFTHKLPTKQERNASASEDQQYYEMIGKYINQFGWGWDDVFDPNFPGNYRGDDAGTPYYDNLHGVAARSAHYMDMRYDSNQLLDYSAIATQVALLNHVASALDASFIVRGMKRSAEAKLGFRAINFDGKPMAVGGLNVRW